MQAHWNSSSLAVTACAGLSFAAAVSQGASDPWTRVVALPTACYSSQDQFAARNQTALAAMKYMQAVGATQDPVAAQEELQARLKRRGELDSQEQQLMQRYQTALKAAQAPVQAKHAALLKKYVNNRDARLRRSGPRH